MNKKELKSILKLIPNTSSVQVNGRDIEKVELKQDQDGKWIVNIVAVKGVAALDGKR